MSAAITAAVGGAIVGGILSNKAAGAQADAANNATNAQVQSSRESLALQKEMFDKQVELNKPWQDAGLEALKSYAYNPAFSFSYNDMTADPSYQFRFQQGVNALDSSAAARGKLLSGAQDKALQSYGQGMASEEYSNAYNRALQNYNTNANTNLNVANIGRGAAGQTQNAIANYSSGAANTLANIGQAQATGAYNAGQAQANGYTNMANTLNSGLANGLYMYNASNSNNGGIMNTLWDKFGSV